MADSGTDRLVTDGCTGFQVAEWLFPAIRACCEVHDFGGTDGALLDCLMGVLPQWTWPVAALCVALMVLVRPIYRLVRPKGPARH
jgi:hypothetical protein